MLYNTDNILVIHKAQDQNYFKLFLHIEMKFL
jgi:hypothetical protein